MKSLFFVNETIKDSSGISKKILAQVDAIGLLSSSCNLCRLDNREGVLVRVIGDSVVDVIGRGGVGKIKSMLRFNSIKKYIVDNGVNFLYIRYTHYSNPMFISFLRSLKRIGVVVVMEIPTYPYDHEYVGASLMGSIKIKVDKIFRRFIGRYVDCILTFSSDKVIFGVEAIGISNAVSNVNVPIAGNNEDENCVHFIAVANLAVWHGYDRFIKSLADYYAGEEKETKLIFNLVGDGPILMQLKKLAIELGVAQYVIFHGPKDGDSLDKVFEKAAIGVDSLGRHRSGNNKNNSLKSKEYLMRGIPIIKSHIDDSISGCGFFFDVPSDDEIFNLEDIVSWYVESGFKKDSIRNFAMENFTWNSQFNKVFLELK